MPRDTIEKWKVRINPDIDSEVIKQQIQHNGGYCPSQDKSNDTLCMCKEFRDMDDGVCRCGLYIKTLNYD